MKSNLSGLQNKEERIQMVPSYPACSKAGENCISTGCCQTSGQKGFTCDVVNPHSVPVATPRGQSLYCFSVYTENTGNETLHSHELELLNIVAERGQGIFSCEQWDVFD